jgi:hypothetical protein
VRCPEVLKFEDDFLKGRVLHFGFTISDFRFWIAGGIITY